VRFGELILHELYRGGRISSHSCPHVCTWACAFSTAFSIWYVDVAAFLVSGNSAVSSVYLVARCFLN
jgi:hypothetical protein